MKKEGGYRDAHRDRANIVYKLFGCKMKHAFESLFIIHYSDPTPRAFAAPHNRLDTKRKCLERFSGTLDAVAREIRTSASRARRAAVTS